MRSEADECFWKPGRPLTPTTCGPSKVQASRQALLTADDVSWKKCESERSLPTINFPRLSVSGAKRILLECRFPIVSFAEAVCIDTRMHLERISRITKCSEHNAGIVRGCTYEEDLDRHPASLGYLRSSAYRHISTTRCEVDTGVSAHSHSELDPVTYSLAVSMPQTCELKSVSKCQSVAMCWRTYYVFGIST